MGWNQVSTSGGFQAFSASSGEADQFAFYGHTGNKTVLIDGFETGDSWYFRDGAYDFSSFSCGAINGGAGTRISVRDTSGDLLTMIMTDLAWSDFTSNVTYNSYLSNITYDDYEVFHL